MTTDRPAYDKYIERKAIRKPHGKLPWGYDVHKDDPMLLVPDRQALRYLDEAKTWLKVASYREVARWLTEKSGRYISHIGLRHRVKQEDGPRIRVADMLHTEEVDDDQTKTD